jgi:cell division protease FtsH
VPATDGGGQRPKRRLDWKWLTGMLVGYLVVFGLLTTQDRMAGAPTVSYSEFMSQAEDGNVAEVFARGDTVQGELREAAPVPGAEGQTYRRSPRSGPRSRRTTY